MMIPKVISETGKVWDDDGTYVKQYVVHAPEWNCIQKNNNRGYLYDKKVNYFVISESTRVGYLETLVFACNKEGKVDNMIEIAGGRDYTADQILTSFATIMMEAGYDPV